jgi:hypothetical protein
MLIKTWFGILDLKIVLDILACFPFEVFGTTFSKLGIFCPKLLVSGDRAYICLARSDILELTSGYNS